jgi:head-tail adaptor
MQKSFIKNFRHKIVILENISISDIEMSLWQEKYILYAEIKAISDEKLQLSENIEFGHVISSEYFIFKTRFCDNIITKMRILFNKRLFEIKRITNIYERNKFLKIIGAEIHVPELH